MKILIAPDSFKGTFTAAQHGGQTKFLTAAGPRDHPSRSMQSGLLVPAVLELGNS